MSNEEYDFHDGIAVRKFVQACIDLPFSGRGSQIKLKGEVFGEAHPNVNLHELELLIRVKKVNNQRIPLSHISRNFGERKSAN